MKWITHKVNKLKQSRLAKDSFWSVFGNGIGNVILLVTSMLVARMLKKDLFGEFGMVKNTMFYIASFSTFGLGYTSTKFIAHAIEEHRSDVSSIVRAVSIITLVSSLIMSALLLLFAEQLALYIQTPQLAQPFRFLGLILITKAVSTTQTGILAGYKAFKPLGINTIISSLVLLVVSLPLTHFMDVYGALLGLLSSQLVLCIANGIIIKRISRTQNDFHKKSLSPTIKKILKFSFPVALQELSYTMCNWGAMLLISKYAAIGEVGLFTAATQWGAIILFIPTLLQNVILSYLSGLTKNTKYHQRFLWQMMALNLICSILPFLGILALSGVITSFYGNSFADLRVVINVYAFATIPMCLTSVLQADLLAKGHNWMLFILRTLRDVVIVVTAYLLFSTQPEQSTALNLSLINVVAYSLSAITLFVFLQRATNKITTKTYTNSSMHTQEETQ